MKNAVGYSTHAVAETTLGAVLALYRQIGYYDRFVKSGAYAAQDVPFHFGLPTHQLHGKRWGVIGLGNIGREVARLAEAFGCTVAYTSTSGQIREERYPALPLRELLAWADVHRRCFTGLGGRRLRCYPSLPLESAEAKARRRLVFEYDHARCLPWAEWQPVAAKYPHGYSPIRCSVHTGADVCHAPFSAGEIDCDFCWAQTLLKTRFDRETSRMLAATNYLEGTRSRRLPSPNSERGRRRPHGKQWPSACYSPECCVAA